MPTNRNILKTWVRSAMTIRPEVNEAFNALSAHYGLTKGGLITKLVSEEVARLGRKGVNIGE